MSDITEYNRLSKQAGKLRLEIKHAQEDRELQGEEWSDPQWDAYRFTQGQRKGNLAFTEECMRELA